MARHVGPYELNVDSTVTCPHCGWSGRVGGHMEIYAEVWDVSCADCGRMLVIAPHPTLEETRAAVATGDPYALANLPGAERAAAYTKRFNETKLADPAQLPEIAGDADLHLEWDTVERRDADSTTTILHEGREIWSELAVFEGAWRFAEVAELLEQRYGKRFRTLTPTKRSEVYLWGDRVTANIAHWFRK